MGGLGASRAAGDARAYGQKYARCCRASAALIHFYAQKCYRINNDVRSYSLRLQPPLSRETACHRPLYARCSSFRAYRRADSHDDGMLIGRLIGAGRHIGRAAVTISLVGRVVSASAHFYALRLCDDG